MYVLLQLLEQREDLPRFAWAAWTMVLLLGIAMLVAAWSQTWTHWMFVTRLGLPVRSELGAMIFSKAMRRKDVKSTSANNDQKSVEESLAAADAVSVSSQADTEPLTNVVEDDLQKSRQTTINLVVSRPSM